MAQPDIQEIFSDCVDRLNQGETLDACLRRYSNYAQQLVPMLETVVSVQSINVSRAEMREDQALIWEELEGLIPDNIIPLDRPRRFNVRLQLLIAVVFLLLLTLSAWFVGSRINQDVDVRMLPIEETLTLFPTLTATVTPSPTVTMTPSPTVTMTPSPTATMTLTPRPTQTQIPVATVGSVQTVPTLLPIITITSPASVSQPTQAPDSASDESECGAPLGYDEMVGVVRDIYPNTTVVEADETTINGDRAVWDVVTSHGIEIMIDAECGYVLSIKQRTNSGSSSNTVNDNSSSSSGSDGDSYDDSDNRDDSDDDDSDDDDSDDDDSDDDDSDDDDSDDDDSDDDDSDDDDSDDDDSDSKDDDDD